MVMLPTKSDRYFQQHPKYSVETNLFDKKSGCAGSDRISYVIRICDNKVCGISQSVFSQLSRESLTLDT